MKMGERAETASNPLPAFSNDSRTSEASYKLRSTKVVLDIRSYRDWTENKNDYDEESTEGRTTRQENWARTEKIGGRKWSKREMKITNFPK